MTRLKKMRVLILCLLSAGFMALSSCIGAVQSNNSDQVPQGDNSSGQAGNSADKAPPVPANCALSSPCPSGYLPQSPDSCLVQQIPPTASCSDLSPAVYIESPTTGNFKLCAIKCYKKTTSAGIDPHNFLPANCGTLSPPCPNGYTMLTPSCLTKQIPLTAPCEDNSSSAYIESPATSGFKLCVSKCHKE